MPQDLRGVLPCRKRRRRDERGRGRAVVLVTKFKRHGADIYARHSRRYTRLAYLARGVVRVEGADTPVVDPLARVAVLVTVYCTVINAHNRIQTDDMHQPAA